MEAVYKQIAEIAEKNGAKKVILFGSRARKTNHPKSDIDLAIYGCEKFDELQVQLNEDLWSLLELDVINMDEPYISVDLIRDIERDGVVIYEKSLTGFQTI